MKTNIINKLSAILLSLAIPACGLEAGGPDSIDELELADREGERYSGEDLFLGIFFGQGEVATRLPTLWGDCSREGRNRVIADMSPEVLIEEIDRLLENPANDELGHHLGNARELLEAGAIHHSDERMYAALVELVHERDSGYFDRLAEVVYRGDRAEILEVIKYGREIIRDIILVDQNPFDPGRNQGVVEVFVVFVAVAVVAYVWLEIEVVGAELDQSRIYEEFMVDEIATQFGAY